MCANTNRAKAGALGRDRASSGRRTNLTILLLAVVCGLASTVVVVHYIQQAIHQHNQPALDPVVTVVRDVPAHTVIDASDVTIKQVGVADVAPGAESSLSQVIGHFTASHWYAGQQVISPMVVSQSQPAGFPLSIPVGKRAFTINDDAVTGVDHLISIGDHVDVVASLQSTKSGSQPITKVLLSDIRVLYVDNPPTPTADTSSQTGKQASNTQTVDTVTLSVTPAQTRVLDNAIATGTIRLALRNPNDSH